MLRYAEKMQGQVDQDKQRQNQERDLNTPCSHCGAYPGQYHHPTCECLVETIDKDNSK
jgi:hypothetical protein